MWVNDILLSFGWTNPSESLLIDQWWIGSIRKVPVSVLKCEDPIGIHTFYYFQASVQCTFWKVKPANFDHPPVASCSISQLYSLCSSSFCMNHNSIIAIWWCSPSKDFVWGTNNRVCVDRVLCVRTLSIYHYFFNSLCSIYLRDVGLWAVLKQSVVRNVNSFGNFPWKCLRCLNIFGSFYQSFELPNMFMKSLRV